MTYIAAEPWASSARKAQRSPKEHAVLRERAAPLRPMIGGRVWRVTVDVVSPVFVYGHVLPRGANELRVDFHYGEALRSTHVNQCPAPRVDCQTVAPALAFVAVLVVPANLRG